MDKDEDEDDDDDDDSWWFMMIHDESIDMGEHCGDSMGKRLWGQYQAKRVAARRAGSSYAYDLPGAAARK